MTVILLLAVGQAAWAVTPVSLSVDPDIPEGTAGHWYVNLHLNEEIRLTLTADDLAAGKGTFKVYDDGGKNGDYTPADKYYSAIYIAAPEGYAIYASGTMWTRTNAYLQFYRYYYDPDGYDYYMPLGDRVASSSDGSAEAVGPYVTLPTNKMKIDFISDNLAGFAGYDLTVTVFDISKDYAINVADGIVNGTVKVDKSIAKVGETVTLTLTPSPGFAAAEVTYNDGVNHTISPSEGVYSFLMPPHDVTVSATFLTGEMQFWGDGNDGTQAKPYVISNKSGWDYLVTQSANNSFANTSFRLDADISGVTACVGNKSSIPFCGYINGNDHTVSLAMESGTQALIGFAGAGCVIEHLTVAGSISTSSKHAAGFIHQTVSGPGEVCLTDCRSSVTITSTQSANSNASYCAGFVGLSNLRLIMRDCVFDGAFISSSIAGFSGLVGEMKNYSLSVNNCVVVPAGTTSLTKESALNPSKNYAFAYTDNSSNISFSGRNYYVYAEGVNGTIVNLQAQGTQTQAWPITLEGGVTAPHDGSSLIVGDNAAYLYNNGFSLGEKEYYTQGTTVTLNHETKDGMTFMGYTATGVTIADNDTFTMPAQHVTVGAQYLRSDYVTHWQASPSRDGSSEDKAYLITTTDGLDLLASEVNGGRTFKDKFFKLDADITYAHGDADDENNFTAIGTLHGNTYQYFNGTFDGQNHTVSGIRMNKDHRNLGLFGGIQINGTVKNIILTDARIRGHDNVGGIVGENKGTILDCIVAGVMLSFNTERFGAIVGDYITSIGIIGNTYHSCLVGYVGYFGYAFNIGLGSSNSPLVKSTIGRGDSTDGKGDSTGAMLDPTKLFLYDDRNNGYLLAAYKDPSAYTAYSGTAPIVNNLSVTLQGHTLYKDGTWNTLCLPFDVTVGSGVLSGAKVKVLDDATSTLSDGTLTLRFVEKTGTIPAGTPFIVKWASGDNIVNPVFTGATVTSAEPTEISSTDTHVKFIGQYAPFKINDGNRSSILFLDAGSKVGYSQADRTLPAFSARFQAEGANKIIVDFGDGTGIHYLTGHLSNGLYWATFYNQDVRYTLPSGAAAYTMGTDHQLYRLGDDGRTIPAGVAVVILSDSADIEIQSITDNTSVTDHAYGGNILRGSNSPVTVTDEKVDGKTPYVLGVAGDPAVLGFYKYTGSFIPANKAYYVE